MMNRNIKFFITAALIWSAITALLFYSFPKIQIGIANEYKYFISSFLLVVLSLSVIFIISKTSFDRKVFLYMVPIVFFFLYKFATPFVAYDKIIFKTGIYCTAFLNRVFHFQSLSYFSKGAILDTFSYNLEDCIWKMYNVLLEKPNVFYAFFLTSLQLCLAISIGFWIARGVDDVTFLFPISVVAAISDIWSVFVGATKHIINSPHINYFLLRYPLIGDKDVPHLIGLSDFIFAAIFYDSARRFDLNSKKTMIAIFIAFMIAVGGALFFKTGLPVLPFMAFAFVAVNYRHLKPTKEQIYTMIYVLCGIALVFWVMSGLL